MYFVSRSATGQYVVTDPSSKTVLVGDDLAATFERMVELAAKSSGGVPAQLDAMAPEQPLKSGVAANRAWLPWLAMGLLPFIWLGALHISLGRLVSEMRAVKPVAAHSDEETELAARLERLERRLENRPAPSARARPPAPVKPAAGGDADEPPEAKADDAKADDAKADDAKADDAKADGKAGETDHED